MSEQVTVYVGRVVTMDEANPEAEAVVTQGDKITFVGGQDDALEFGGPDSVVVQLEGQQTLLPGFIDGHGHLGLVALFAGMTDLTPAPVGKIKDIPDLVAHLQAALAETGGTPKDGWIMGCNYDDALMAEKRHPTADELDAVSTEYPIAIIHASGHLAVLNNKAMEVVSITADTPNPVGGVIRKDANGQPDGILEEHAWMDLVVPHIPRPSPEEAVKSLVAGQLKYASQGFTTVQEGFTDESMMALLQGANGVGATMLDIVAYPSWLFADALLKGHAPGDGYAGRVRVGGVKIVLDGSPQGKTAWLTEPYLIPPEGMPADYSGYPAMPDADAYAAVAKHHAEGWPVLAHCNGDAACEQFIGAATAARGDEDSRDPRDFVMIHAQTVREDQLDKIVDIGMTPSFFVTHVYYWGDWHRDSVLGPERADRISPTESARKRGIRFSLHNDSPVAPIWSMILIATAVNRLTLSGKVLGEDQRIPVEQALKAMTIDGAYQYGEEAVKGSIETGKQADLVVLSGNPLTIDSAELTEIKVLRTISRGTTVYAG